MSVPMKKLHTKGLSRNKLVDDGSRHAVRANSHLASGDEQEQRSIVGVAKSGILTVSNRTSQQPLSERRRTGAAQLSGCSEVVTQPDGMHRNPERSSYSETGPKPIEVIVRHQGTDQRFVAERHNVRSLVRYLKANAFVVTAEESQESIAWEMLAKEQLSKMPRGAIALRGARVKEGLSQTDLAHLLKTDQSNVSKMEQGARPIGKGMAHRLNKILKVDYRLFL